MPNLLHYAPEFPPIPKLPRNPAPLLLLPLLPAVILLIVALFQNDRTGCTPQNAAKSDLSNIASTLETYASDNGRYPTSAEGLDALMIRPANLPTWNGPYLTHAPVDPWKRPYVYRFPAPANPKTYDLLSLGRDGILRTSDDIRLAN